MRPPSSRPCTRRAASKAAVAPLPLLILQKSAQLAEPMAAGLRDLLLLVAYGPHGVPTSERHQRMPFACAFNAQPSLSMKSAGRVPCRRYITHAASPVHMDIPPSQAFPWVVTPAAKGVLNVLAAANNAGTVGRVVMTSSVVACMGSPHHSESDQSHVDTEAYWNVTFGPHMLHVRLAVRRR